MPKLVGLFDSFDSLDQISPENIASWLKAVPEPHQLENYLANRILYPQVFPLTQSDMQIDLSILREALKLTYVNPDSKNFAMLEDSPFLNTTMRKIFIPIRFLDFVPDLVSLVLSFIDAFLSNREKKDYFSDLWTVVLTDDIDEVVGSVLLPQFNGNGGTINLKVVDQDYQIRPGNLMVIPCSKDRCEIVYRLQKGKILGKEENAIEVCGGKLGVIVDGRKK